MALDLYALIDHCALDASAPTQTVLHQLVVATSQGDPLHVLDLSESKTYTPSSEQQAIGITAALIEAGHQVRVGLTLLDPVQTELMGWSMVQLFDPCTALAITSDAFRGMRTSNKASILLRYLDPRSEHALDGLVQLIVAQPEHKIGALVEQGQRWPGRAYTLTPRSDAALLLPEQSNRLKLPTEQLLLPKPQHTPVTSVVVPTKWSEDGIPEQPGVEVRQEATAPMPAPSSAKVPADNSVHVKRARRAQPPVTKERLQ